MCRVHFFIMSLFIGLFGTVKPVDDVEYYEYKERVATSRGGSRVQSFWFIIKGHHQYSVRVKNKVCKKCLDELEYEDPSAIGSFMQPYTDRDGKQYFVDIDGSFDTQQQAKEWYNHFLERQDRLS